MAPNDESLARTREAFEALKGGDETRAHTVLEFLRTQCEADFRDELARRLKGRLTKRSKAEQAELVKEYSKKVFKRAGADALILVYRDEITSLEDLLDQFRTMLRYGTLYIVVTDGGL